MSMFERFPALVLLACAAAGAILGGCHPSDSKTPLCGVLNDSDSSLRVRFWVGDRDPKTGVPTSEPRDGPILEVRPGNAIEDNIGLDLKYKSTAETFVRVQIRPIGASFVKVKDYWFELNPPAPFKVRVFGVTPDLKFERRGDGTMTTVPKSLWLKSTE